MIKHVPDSARDMWWAQQQAAGHAKVMYEDSKNTPEEGALSSTEVSVRPCRNHDLIEVRKELDYYGHKDENSWGWPIHAEVEWSREMTFNEFRASEWWDTYLERSKNLNFDSSWMDSFNVDCDDSCAEVMFDKPDYKKVWWCSRDVPTGYTTSYSVLVCNDGTVSITRGNDKTVERTVDEFLDAVEFFERASKLGVSIDDDGTITIGRGEGDAEQ